MDKIGVEYRLVVYNDLVTYKKILETKSMRYPRNFWCNPWSKISSGVILRYLFNERLNIAEDDIPKIISNQLLVDLRLDSMRRVVFRGSLYDALDNAYKGKFNPEQIHRRCRREYR